MPRQPTLLTLRIAQLLLSLPPTITILVLFEYLGKEIYKIFKHVRPTFHLSERVESEYWKL